MGVEFVSLPASWPAGVERIEVRAEGQPVGDVDVRRCDQCRVAVLEHIRVEPTWRRRGLARQAVHTLLTRYPDQDWYTTAVQPEAAGFWAAVGWPIATLGEPSWCAHMYEADRHMQ